MRLSEFNITKGTKNLSQRIFEVFKELGKRGEGLLEWDIDGLVFDKDFIVEQRYISNTASERELKNSVRNIAIKLEGVQNLVIDGLGNSVYYNNRCVQIELICCENVTFKNFNFDYINPTVSEFIVVGKGFNYIDIKINKDTLYEIKNGKLRFFNDDGSRLVTQELEPKTNVTRRAFAPRFTYTGHNAFNNLRCKQLQDGIVRVYKFANPFVVGNVYQLNWIRRDGTGFFADRCKNIAIDNCHFKFMHGMGVLCQLTENVTITNTKFLPNKDRERTNVAFADVMHFVNCKGDVRVENCIADGTRDDVINLHGIHFKVIKKNGNKVVCKFCHPQTYGFNCFFAGDEIDFINRTTLKPVASAKVKASKMLNPRKIELELKDFDDEEDIKVGMAIENATWTASLYVDGLQTFNVPTRGILVTTRKPVVIKNSTFNKCYMPSILLSDDARTWYESGFVRDVTIENNTFIDCGSYAIDILPENLAGDYVHKNIKIIGNKFVSKNGKILRVKCAKDVVFENNEIICEVEPIFDLKNVEDSNIKLCN